MFFEFLTLIYSTFQLRIAIQQAANGAPPVKKESVEFIEESAMQSPDDMEKGNINFAFVRKKTDHPTLVHHFSAGIERKRTEVEKEPEHDILTPALKVVHPSAASLHHFYNHPLLTIQEEDAFCSSQNSTIVDSANSSLPRPSILKFVFYTFKIINNFTLFPKLFCKFFITL